MEEPYRYRKHRDTDAEIDPERCAASVSDEGRWMRSYQCQFKRKFGDWCGIHDPEKAAERAKRRPPTQYELTIKKTQKQDAEFARLRQERDEPKITIPLDQVTRLQRERDEVREEVGRLRSECNRARWFMHRLSEFIEAEEDFDQDATDGVTVRQVWLRQLSDYIGALELAAPPSWSE